MSWIKSELRSNEGELIETSELLVHDETTRLLAKVEYPSHGSINVPYVIDLCMEYPYNGYRKYMSLDFAKAYCELIAEAYFNGVNPNEVNRPTKPKSSSDSFWERLFK